MIRVAVLPRAALALGAFLKALLHKSNGFLVFVSLPRPVVYQPVGDRADGWIGLPTGILRRTRELTLTSFRAARHRRPLSTRMSISLRSVSRSLQEIQLFLAVTYLPLECIFLCFCRGTLLRILSFASSSATFTRP
jgi:hypothetical protein